MAKKGKPMSNEIVMVTEHYGYKKQPTENVFAVYKISGKQKRIVSAFAKERSARRECLYLEKLNYIPNGGKKGGWVDENH